MKLLLLLASMLVVAKSQDFDMCLAEPMAEMNVSVVVIRAEEGLCEDSNFVESIQEAVMSNYNTSTNDNGCFIGRLTVATCSERVHSNRRRTIFILTTNLTCSSSSDGCTRHSLTSNKESFRRFKDKESTIRTAMRVFRKTRILHNRLRLRVQYFVGRGSLIDVCMGPKVSTIRQKLTLCSCPAHCPPEDNNVCLGKMVYKECGTACPATCADPEPFICTRQCVQGCFCPEGTVEHEGKCVSPEECPRDEEISKEVTTASTPQQCPGIQIYKECGTACPQTCRVPELFGCILVCVQGCFCPEGTVQHEGECIAPEECPRDEETPKDVTTSTTPQCPGVQVYSDCGTACPPTCAVPEPYICTLQCVQGCFCPEGTVQHDGECVAPENCPTDEETSKEVTTPPTPQCPIGMIHKECGSACPPTCENSQQFCTLPCVQGCFCPEGTVEFEGVCVAPEKCPRDVTTPSTTPQCPGIQFYSNCGTACPLTCADPEPVICTFQCAQGCFCPQGTVKHEGECIAPENCPTGEETSKEVTTGPPTPTTPQCPIGMIYKECGSTCPSTCENSQQSCISQCVQGCFCEEGMVAHEGGCIALDSCPKDDEEENGDEKDEDDDGLRGKRLAKMRRGKGSGDGNRKDEDIAASGHKNLYKDDDKEEYGSGAPTTKCRKELRGKKGEREDNDEPCEDEGASTEEDTNSDDSGLIDYKVLKDLNFEDSKTNDRTRTGTREESSDDVNTYDYGGEENFEDNKTNDRTRTESREENGDDVTYEYGEEGKRG